MAWEFFDRLMHRRSRGIKDRVWFLAVNCSGHVGSVNLLLYGKVVGDIVGEIVGEFVVVHAIIRVFPVYGI